MEIRMKMFSNEDDNVKPEAEFHKNTVVLAEGLTTVCYQLMFETTAEKECQLLHSSEQGRQEVKNWGWYLNSSDLNETSLSHTSGPLGDDN